jgi:hypothetical protein
MSSNAQAGSVATLDVAPAKGAATDTGGCEPWLGYDEQHMGTIQGFVAKSSPSQARAVRVYESANMGRVEVIEAADRRLAKWRC